MNPRISHILSVTPFLVTVEWSNGEKTKIDFAYFLSEERNKDSVFSKLFVKEIFNKVKTFNIVKIKVMYRFMLSNQRIYKVQKF